MTMVGNHARVLLAANLLAMLTLTGCSGRPAITMPSIDPSSAGELAMEQYDKNSDGIVNGAELDDAPSLKSALSRLDTNSDGGVSADEIAARVERWKKMKVGLTAFGFDVTLDGKPLPDATVTFVPESFLGDEVKSASCTTNQLGGGGATIAPEDRPDSTSPPGMHLGLYKVKVSKLVGGKESIPAKYNEATILGQEAAPDVSEILNRKVVYKLTTK